MDAKQTLTRRRFLAAGLAGVASTAAAGTLTAAPAAAEQPAARCPEPAARVSAEPSQTMQGFGASGAWWPNDLVTFDASVRDRVADLLFGPDGIMLSVYRYNIGGGGIGVTHPGHDTQTFLVAPGVYDWGRDPGGSQFLRLAAVRNVPILVGFAKSAPPVWTTNNQSNGGQLQPGAVPAYAAYLTDVVAHLHDDEGITLSYLSPMNEPDYLFAGTFQEGMGVPVEQRAPLIEALGEALRARAPYCRVIADESSRTGEHFLHEVARWLPEGNAAKHVAALAQHRYDFPNDLTLGLARDVSERVGKPLWCTEVCCFDSRTGDWGQQYDPTIASGLMLANLIWQGLTVANDAAFHWWLACSPVMGCDPFGSPESAAEANDEGWNDGLLYYDPNFRENGNQAIYPTKRYFAMGQFSRYVRPEDRRYEVVGAPRDLRVLAFGRPHAADDGTVGVTVGPTATPAVTPVLPMPAAAPVQLPASVPNSRTSQTDGQRLAPDVSRWSVVVINRARAGSNPAALSLQIPLPARGVLVPEVAVETSAGRSLESVPLPGVSATGVLSAAVPAQSITTYVLRVSVTP